MVKAKKLTSMAMDQSGFFVSFDRPLETAYFAAGKFPFESDAKTFAEALSLSSKYDVVVLDNNIIDAASGPLVMKRYNSGKEI